MRILIVLHDYLPRHTGGSEIHAHQTALELARRGHEVSALFTERDLSARDGIISFPGRLIALPMALIGFHPIRPCLAR